MAYAELTIDQGTTFETSINLTNDDGTYIDVTDYTFQCQIRKSYYSMNPTANVTVSIVNPINGAVKLSLTAAETANVKAGRYLYDLKMTTDAAVTTRVLEGIITVSPQVSK